MAAIIITCQQQKTFKNGQDYQTVESNTLNVNTQQFLK